MFIALGIAIGTVFVSNYLLERYEDLSRRSVRFAGWAGIVSIINISVCLAAVLIHLTKAAGEAAEPAVPSEHLSGVSYVILSVVFLMIIGGLGWCFYRAIMAGSQDAPAQYAEE